MSKVEEVIAKCVTLEAEHLTETLGFEGAMQEAYEYLDTMGRVKDPEAARMSFGLALFHLHRIAYIKGFDSTAAAEAAAEAYLERLQKVTAKMAEGKDFYTALDKE